MKTNKKVKRFIFPMLIFLVAIGIAYFFIHIFHFLSNHDTEEVHFFIFVATGILALIAYYEFSKSNELTANEFLLFSSNRWNSKEILKARKILHKIFIETYRNENGQATNEYHVALHFVSKKILDMSRSKDVDFIYLLNLLDYLETLSYFYKRGDLEINDVQNTCGNNVLFFYESFSLFIKQRQSHDSSFFINFTKLYNDLVLLKANHK